MLMLKEILISFLLICPFWLKSQDVNNLYDIYFERISIELDSMVKAQIGDDYTHLTISDYENAVEIFSFDDLDSLTFELSDNVHDAELDYIKNDIGLNLRGNYVENINDGSFVDDPDDFHR